MSIKIPPPTLQVNFASLLTRMGSLYLQKSLFETVAKLDIAVLDEELSRFGLKESLSILAQHGLRGELVLAVPLLLSANPYLLGYYRLLLGFSQKEFYGPTFDCARFKPMEMSGKLSSSNIVSLPSLCEGLGNSAAALIKGLTEDDIPISKSLLSDLTLITLGAQLRGGANVLRGKQAIDEVFQIIHGIVGPAVVKNTTKSIQLKNAAGRIVDLEFASDPDITIKEKMSENQYRNILAIEVKGGKDFSNIHNRIGEAEKSHQKAKNSGYTECWTVINVDHYDSQMAHRESPSTNRFYLISDIRDSSNPNYQDFCARIISLTGLKRSP